MTPLKYLALGRITNGVGLPAEHEEPSWPRYIRTTDIAGPRSLRQDVWFSQPPELINAAGVRRDDLLLTNAGATIGKSYLHMWDDPGVYAGYLTRVRPDPTKTDPRFLAYFTDSQAYWDQIIVGATRSTIDNFSSGRYQSLLVPAPPLEVQRRIADYLDIETARIDRLRDRNQELARLARERHERFVITSVTEGAGSPVARRAVDGRWFTTCNSTFQVGPYAMYGRTGSGHTPSRSVAEYWVDCDIPWITTGDVKPLRPGFIEYVDDSAERISALGMANSAARLHPTGTVFLSRTASVGFAGIMAVPMATSQDFFTWTPDRSRLRPEYLLWALRAMRYAGHFDRLMYGSTHKTIYVPDLMVLRGPVPAVDEQDRIVDAIREQRDETIALLDNLERANRLLAERRQALITATVTGELGV